MLHPNASRIRELLRDLEDCREDLANARTAEEAADVRANMNACQHSLWLAGYSPEEEA